MPCGSGVQQRGWRCRVCSNYWFVQTRLCTTSCANHRTTTEGLLEQGKQNAALVQHSIKEMWVSSPIQCAHHCLRLAECQSINIGKEENHEGDGATKAHVSWLCQLNNGIADSEPAHLVQRNGFHYYSFMLKHYRE